MTDDRDQRANLPVSYARSCAVERRVSAGRARGFAVNHQTVELGVWLGIAVLALIWANLSLWRARRVLSRARQNNLVQEISTLPPVALQSSPLSEPASSALAS